MNARIKCVSVEPAIEARCEFKRNISYNKFSDGFIEKHRIAHTRVTVSPSYTDNTMKLLSFCLLPSFALDAGSQWYVK